MNLQYILGNYIDEIIFEDRPVLFTLDGLADVDKGEADAYGEKIWQWIISHRDRVCTHAQDIAVLKNKRWREEGEPEMSAEEVWPFLKCIASIYVIHGKGFYVYFDTGQLFPEHSVVLHMGDDFVFRGVLIL